MDKDKFDVVMTDGWILDWVVKPAVHTLRRKPFIVQCGDRPAGKYIWRDGNWRIYRDDKCAESWGQWSVSEL